jgi:hypothetical protein
LLEVGDHLHRLLKLGVPHVNVMLKVDDLASMDIHLLTSDVKQLRGLVPPMLSLIKSTVSDL